MEFMGTEIHWLAVFAAAFVGFAVGGIWYGPLFGKVWARARGLGAAHLEQGFNAPLVYGLVFLLNLFSAFILDHTVATYGNPGLSLTVMITGGVALGFIVPAIAVNYLFSRTTRSLFVIDGGYWLSTYILMGVVLDMLA